MQSYSTKEEQSFVQNTKRIRTKEKYSIHGSKKYRSIKRDGDICYMCPQCYNIIETKINSKIKVSATVDSGIYPVFCEGFYGTCHRCTHTDEFIEIDPNMGRIIETLNNKGYYTAFCCEGHGREGAYVSFKSAFIIRYSNSLPIEWEFDMNDFKVRKQTILRAITPKSEWRESLYVLNQWIDSLPKIDLLETMLMSVDKYI